MGKRLGFVLAGLGDDLRCCRFQSLVTSLLSPGIPRLGLPANHRDHGFKISRCPAAYHNTFNLKHPWPDSTEGDGGRTDSLSAGS